jgi:Fe2+ or Zn2+ uptake regulation protein
MGPTPATAVEGLIERLRAAGERITTPKRALAAALVAADGHRTAEELIAEIQVGQPDVHKATIYRNLRSLEDRGIVEHVHLGHGPAVYHLADKAHHHLVCDMCGRIQELPDKALAPLLRRLENDFGFRANSRHFAISGRCSTCR